MEMSGLITLLFFFFAAFSIGLNLGLHGVISIQSWGPDRFTAPSPIEKAKGVSRNKEQLPDESKGHLDEVEEGEEEEEVEEHRTSEYISSPDKDSSEESPVDSSSKANNADADAAKSMIISMSIEDKILAIDTSSEVLDAIKKSSSQSPSEAGKKLELNMEEGPIARYIKDGNKIPIILLTCNRPELLAGTLKSLLAVKGVEESDVTVLQDGGMSAVADVVKGYPSIKLVQNMEGIRLRGGTLDGGQRIARHYKYSLSAAFRKLHSKAPAVIIVEDDLLFSPDFYEYFTAVSPLLETDPSLFLASAWNDNGFKGKVSNPFGLKRTEFFPGLGWLLPRKLYEEELEAQWPYEHWDHWLRSSARTKGREIIYPEVPRTFHNGIKGTFMNLDTHNRYFRDIAYNTDSSLSWREYYQEKQLPNHLPPYLLASKEVYDSRIALLVSVCTHIQEIGQLIESPPGSINCLWLNVYPEPNYSGQQDFEGIASFFGIWHEHKRAGHRGLHDFYWEGRYILLLNVNERNLPMGDKQPTSFKNLKPIAIPIIDKNLFDKRLISDLKKK